MPILSSRPSDEPSDDDIITAALPAVNIVTWLCDVKFFRDDNPGTIITGREFLEDALNCLMLVEYSVVALPGTARFLVYEVVVKPRPGPAYVSFKAQFRILP